ncbi:MAG: carbohydrate-binding family 9-like protein [Armatimonadetes bacterium]|nr:carbohydrate-binding family 9-like protein [Armatimonadota bacterium]
MQHPRAYACARTATPPPLGNLADPAWEAAPWIDSWIGIMGGETNAKAIRARLLWDDTGLYLGVQMQEDDLWASVTEHDGDVWQDPCFELFLDPDGDGHNYLEWEVNVIGTVLDLSMDRPYVTGGTRDDSLEVAGLAMEIMTDGPVNDPSTRAGFWQVGAAIPWRALNQIGHPGSPPECGETWRFQLMKMEYPAEVADGKYRKSQTEAEKYWCFAPTLVMDIHRPWFWGYLHFAESASAQPPVDPDWDTKFALCRAMGLDSRSRAEGPLACGKAQLVPGMDLTTQTDGYALAYKGWRLDSQGRMGRI